MKNKITTWIFGTLFTLGVYVAIYFTALKEYDFGSFFGEMTLIMLIAFIIVTVVVTFFLIFFIILISLMLWEVMRGIFKTK